MPKLNGSIARAIAVVAAMTLGSAVGFAPAAAQPVELRIATFAPPPLELTLVWNEKPGITRHYGKSYTIKPVAFRASPLMITGIAANEVDLVHLGPSQLNLAVANAGLSDLRILAEEIVDGQDGYYSSSFFVLKDGPIKTPADLKGKVVATFAVGSNVDLATRNYLSKFGLELNRDFTLLEAAPPNHKAILLEKKADLAVIIPPFSNDPDVVAKARVLFTARDGYGMATSPGMWMARQAYIAKHRAALVDFLEDYLRLGRWFWDPKNRTEALEMSSRISKVPVSVMEGYSLTNKDAYRPLDGIPDVVGSQVVIETQKRLGMAKSEIKLTDFTDLSLINEANARLK